MAKNKPEKTFKAGAVQVAVFRNSGEYGVYRTCSVSIRYKRGDNWEYGSNMKASDAIVAAALLDDARKYMMAEDARENASRNSRRREEPACTEKPGRRVAEPADEDAPF